MLLLFFVLCVLIYSFLALHWRHFFVVRVQYLHGPFLSFNYYDFVFPHTVFIFYTGDSEVGTGNWCFKDGVITFRDIYDIYIQCFKGKRLPIISDCSYSGSWVKESAKIYDEQGILSCGHHSRERGILMNVLASCKAYQQATILTYVKKAMEVAVTDVVYYRCKKLSSGQETVSSKFIKISCNNKPDQQCQYTDSENDTWKNRLAGDRVYCVRVEDRGRPTWCCVLVDEDKEQAFRDKVESDTVYVADYGKVLYSGWGEDPPQYIVDKIRDRYW